MTINSQFETNEAPPAPLSRTYVAPTFTLLGHVGRLTAGPGAGTLDTLVGSTGGFVDEDPDGTS